MSTVIAVDGPAASGKGTLARKLARRLGFAHLDTGKLYRGVAAALLAAGRDPADAAAATAAARSLDPGTLEDQALGSDRIGQAASIVAAIPAVREALLQMQRDFARTPPGRAAGAVLDGRDVGTVICPDAAVKFYLIAAPAERARRRHDELLARGEASIYAEVLAEITERDRRDTTRPVAPLRPAHDAVVLDTTRLDADAVFDAALAVLAARGLVQAGGGGV